MATKSQFYADLGLESASNLQVDGNATITGNFSTKSRMISKEEQYKLYSFKK